jgi:hypothetical protein
MRTVPIMTRATLAALAALASLALAAPARAQTGNQSDVSGPYSNGPFNGGLRLENEMFSRVGNEVVFRTARTGCALRGAEQAYRDSVAPLPHTPAEQRVLDLLAVTAGTPPTDAVAAALARGADPASPLGQAARRLADALTGLMQNRGGCGDSRDDYPEAPQWEEALKAYNDYVRGAPDSALSPPAPELLAIHDALQSVVTRALRNPNAR